MTLSTLRAPGRGRTGASRRRTLGCYVAIGLRPDGISAFTDELEEEEACLLQIAHDDEGSALVFFHLAAGDPGDWLPALARRWGCGLAPAARP